MPQPGLVVALGVVEPAVGAAALGASDRAGDQAVGHLQHRAQLDRLDQVGVEVPPLVLHDNAAVVALAQLLHLRLAGLKPLGRAEDAGVVDRKSTRLNSSHANISYAVF